MAQPQQQAAPGVVRFYNFLSEDVSFLGEVLSGLSAPLVHGGGERSAFGPGESVLSGIFCKYSIEEFHELAQRAGFAPAQGWNDLADLFSVQGMLAV